MANKNMTDEDYPPKATEGLGISPPPPGAPAGGTWGKNRYRGSNTCVGGLLGCLCFFIPGLLVLCCPLDERDAYRAPNGKVYDASGHVIGQSAHTNFKAERP